jgi:hypothetical protein
MTDRLAPPELRVLAPRAFALGTDDGEALQNVDTSKLPDGCWAYASDVASYYRFVRAGGFTSANASDAALITPTSGPGQWVVEVGIAALSFSYQIALNAEPVTVTDGTGFLALPGTATWTDDDALTTAGTLTPTAFWSVSSPSAGVLTYSGPPRYFDVYGMLSCNNGESGSRPMQFELYISKNAALLGSTSEPVRSAINSEPTTPGEVPVAVSYVSRLLMRAGDTVQLLVIDRAAAGDDIAVVRASIAVIPV